MFNKVKSERFPIASALPGCSVSVAVQSCPLSQL
jgi:hypothetical protein